MITTQPGMEAHASEVNEAPSTVQHATTSTPTAIDDVDHQVENSPHSAKASALESEPRRAAFINARIYKVTRETKLGIRFRSVSGNLEIDSLAPSGLLSSSPLRAGDRLVGINDVACASWSPEQASRFVREISGYVFFVAENWSGGNPRITETAVYKINPHDRVGIAFSSENGQLRVKAINPSGLLAGAPGVAAGDLILSINNVHCSEIGTGTALSMVRSSHELVTFLTKRADTGDQSDLEAVSLPHQLEEEESCVESDNRNRQSNDAWSDGESKIEVSPNENGARIISASSSGLETDRLPRFNQDKRLTPSFVKSLPVADALPEVKKSYSVVATTTDVIPVDIETPAAPTTTPHVTTSVRAAIINTRVFKKTVSSKIGITFGSVGGNLHVKSLSPTGLLASSSLLVGDRVLRLNNTSCAHWTSERAVRLLRETKGFVYIVVKNPAYDADYNTTETTIHKVHPNQKLGVQFTVKNGKLRLKFINPTGLMGGGGEFIPVLIFVKSPSSCNFFCPNSNHFVRNDL